MATVPVPPVPPVPPAPASSRRPTLRELVDQLERVLEPMGWDQPPVAVGIGADGEIELALATGDMVDPIGSLVGIDAKRSWIAYGVVASGRVHDLEEEGGRCYSRRRPVEQRARMGHFVDRTGAVTAYFRLQGGPDRVCEEPSIGRVDDICRRALGLPTSMPASPVELLWACRWLERVLVAAAEHPTEVATWPRVAAHHAALARSTAADRAAPESVDDLVVAGRWLAEQSPWEALRAQAARRERRFEAVTAAQARWMDAGMFSRWLLMDLTPLAYLREAVADALPADVAVAVDEALDGWALP